MADNLKRCLAVFFFLALIPGDLLAQPPFGRGSEERGRPGETGQEPRTGVVSEVRGNEITLSLRDGQRQVVTLSPYLNITRERTMTAEDLRPGADVMVVGRTDGGSIRAEVIRLLPKGVAMPPGGRDGREMNAGPVTGKVVSASPLRIMTASGERQVDISGVRRIFEETTVAPDEIKAGDQVLILGGAERVFKLILQTQRSAMGPGPAPGQARGLSPREAPGQSRLPMPPVPEVSYFSKREMDRSRDSQFGFKDPNMPRIDLFLWYDDYGRVMNDLGVNWMEPAASFGFSWEQVQRKNQDNTYTAFDWVRYDRLVKNAQAYNMHISAIIIAREPLAERGQRRPPSLPADLLGYQNFVRALVERYDGDGRDDMPGLLYPLKNWKIEDEAMAKIYFNGTPSDYARLVNAAYDAIKQSDSGANVILAMVRGYDGFKEADPRAFMEGFFSEFARLSRVRKWDTIDQHSMIVSRTADPAKQYLEIGRYVEDVKAASKRYGFEPAPFWAMEVAGIDPPPEKAHAVDLFKRYIYAFSVGVRKVFWSGLAEKPPQSTSGIKDPLEKATLIDSRGQKKLAYYTYKKMVSMLDGFDVSRVETIRHDGVYVFRFSRDNKPVWVAWNDFGPAVREKLSVPRGARVTVVEAVPDAGTGAEIRDYANAFRTIEGKAMSGVFEFEIGATPLIITVD